MSSRRRYLLSTTRAAWAGALVGIASTLYALAERLDSWRGDWWWGYNNLAQAIPVLMVLVSLTVGWQAGSRSAGHVTLIERGPDSLAKVIGGLVLAPFGAALVTYLLGGFAVALVTLTNNGTVSPTAILVIVSHASMIALAAAVGLAAGSLIPAPYSAPVAAGLVGGLLFLAPPGADNLFTLTGPVQPVVGQSPSIARHAIILVACLVASTALTWLASRRIRQYFRVFVAIGIAVSTVAVGSYLLPTNTFVQGREEASRCVSTPVEVCIYPGYDRLLRPASQQIDALRADAISEGVVASELPSRYQQFGGARPQVGVGTLSVNDDALSAGRLSPADLALSISDPLWCASMFADTPPVKLLERRDAVYDWLLWLQGALPEQELVARHQRLAAEPKAKWSSLITEDLGLLRKCAN